MANDDVAQHPRSLSTVSAFKGGSFSCTPSRCSALDVCCARQSTGSARRGALQGRAGDSHRAAHSLRESAKAIATGHCFIIFLGEGFYPLNLLNTVKMVPEVWRIFCATANPTEVILAETEQRRAILGDIEGDDDILWRKNLLQQAGYKL